MPEEDNEVTENGFMLSELWYKRFKWLVQIVIPAFGTLYLSLDKFWNVPNEEAVAGTCLVVATFLGVILGISNRTYVNSDSRFDGEVHITQAPDGGVKTYSLVMNGDPEDIDGKSEVTFKVAQ